MELSVSLLFPAFNRLEFTKQSWAALMANTDWSLVSEFHVYDDGSTDGTREWLRPGGGAWAYGDAVGHLVVQHHDTNFRSPMGVTLDWIKRSRAPMLAKLDNDTIYPPYWLNIALDVMSRNPTLDMLGLECMRAPARLLSNATRAEVAAFGPPGRVPMYADPGKPAPARFDYLREPTAFISGLGLYRREAFAKSLPQDNGYFGLEEWQQAQAHLKYGWILPSLPTILLDRLPIEPWKSLSESYVKKGWQRPWSLELRYKPEQHAIWDWWTSVEPVK